MVSGAYGHTLLIEQGNQADSAFIINDGMIDIIITHKKREVVLQQLNKGDFFGELALLAQFDWYFSARAATDLQALVIERSSFQKILEKYPDYKDQLIERIVQVRVDRLIDQTNFILEKMVLSDTDQAMMHYRRALELNPDDEDAAKALAELFRVIAPGGRMYLQIPIVYGATAAPTSSMPTTG